MFNGKSGRVDEAHLEVGIVSQPWGGMLHSNFVHKILHPQKQIEAPQITQEELFVALPQCGGRLGMIIHLYVIELQCQF